RSTGRGEQEADSFTEYRERGALALGPARAPLEFHLQTCETRIPSFARWRTPQMNDTPINRRTFVGTAVGLASAAALAPLRQAGAAEGKEKRIKVGVIGCGSVSGVYLPNLSKCAYVEVVSACDIIPERAKRRAEAFKIPNQYPHIDKMLAGAEFDLLV